MKKSTKLQVVYDKENARLKAEPAVSEEYADNQIDISKLTMQDLQLAVNIKVLKSLLCCGAATANIIADEAQANVRIGRRVRLYYLPKIKSYLESISI